MAGTVGSNKSASHRSSKRKSNRGRRRGRLSAGRGISTFRSKTEVQFISAPPPNDGYSVWSGLSGWWFLALELAQLIIGWVVTKAAPEEESKRLICLKESDAPDAKTKLYFYDSNKTRTPLKEDYHEIMFPIACCSRVALSVDNFISRTQVVRALIKGNPKNAPSPYNGDVKMFTTYFTVPYSRYRLVSVSFHISDQVPAIMEYGVYHVGFQPYGVDEYFDGFADDGKDKGLPRIEYIKSMMHYRRLTNKQKGTSIVWKPRGYWAEWRQLGYPVEATELKIGDLEWSPAWGGVGTSPFGELAIAHEIDCFSTASLKLQGRDVPIYGPENTSLTISCNAVYELSGNEQMNFTSVNQNLDTNTFRVIRGYFLQPYSSGFVTNVYQCAGYLFRDKRHPITINSLDQMVLD